MNFVLEKFSSVIVEDDVERISLNLKTYLDENPQLLKESKRK